MATVRAVFFDVGNTLAHLDYGFLCDALEAEGGPRVTEDAFAVADARVRQEGIPQAHSVGPDRQQDSPAPASLQGFFRRYMGAVADGLGSGAFGRPLGDRACAEHQRRALGLWSIPDPDADSVLRALTESGIRCGAISNADGRVREQLGLLGFLRWLDPVIDSTEVGAAKPDPVIFQTALSRAGVQPEASLYVGDMLKTDAEAACAVGMVGVLYDRMGVLPKDPDGASRVLRIRRLGEVLDCVAEASSRLTARQGS